MQSRYCTALYFCFTALISVGFGNVAPNTDAEKLYAIVMMLLGCEWEANSHMSSCFGWAPIESKKCKFGKYCYNLVEVSLSLDKI